jgi:putative addiction module component (TIGR02574 family)
MSIAEIREEALRLSEEDRAELVALIVDSFEGADPNDTDADSLAEARARSEELSSGKVVGISETAFFEAIRDARK